LVGRFLRRFGIALLASVVGAAGTFIGTFDWSELGVYAVLVAAAAALVAGGLAKLAEKIRGWLGETPPL
jgi:hypothetical protein